jgi:hypothetical protein
MIIKQTSRNTNKTQLRIREIKGKILAAQWEVETIQSNWKMRMEKLKNIFKD